MQTVTPIQLALQHHQAGRLQEAEQIYRQILSADPNNADANHFLGIIAHQIGKNDIALQYFKKAIQAKPDNPEPYSNLGNALRELGRLKESVASCRKSISIKPDFAEAHCNLGCALIELGRMDEAIASYHKAISIKPDFAAAQHNLGNALKKSGQLDEAIASYHKAISIRPDFAEAHNNLGNALKYSGRLDDAIASYNKAISIKPDFALAHLNLSNAKNHQEYDDAISAMETFYARDDISSEQRRHLALGLGKAFEDLNEHKLSFDFILEANRLKRATYQYKIEEDKKVFDKIKEVFSPTFFFGHSHAGNPDETAIFILGMPRSGKTLVEQILASHSQVFGAGELKDLANTVNTIRSMRTGKKFLDCVSGLNEEELFVLGSSYIERIRKHSGIEKCITNTMPYNFKRIGLIKVILPKAKVIHCLRDPMDNCFSIFKQNFAEEHKYTYEMKELGQYYNLYLDLMNHWRRIIPDFIYDFSYEELVANQEEQTRKLLAYCGLPWEESCLSFHKTKRRVETASAIQVVRSLNSDSIQLWKKYEKQLEPLRKALYD